LNGNRDSLTGFAHAKVASALDGADLDVLDLELVAGIPTKQKGECLSYDHTHRTRRLRLIHQVSSAALEPTKAFVHFLSRYRSLTKPAAWF
jgi:hypothetical protein